MVFAPLQGGGFVVELLVWLDVFVFLCINRCALFFFKAKSGRCIVHLERKAVVFVKVSVCLSFSKAWEIVEFRLGPLSEGKLVSPCFLEDELRWFAREPCAKLGEDTDLESAGQDHQLGDLPVSWVTFQIRGSDHGNSLSSVLYCMKLYCREWRGSVGFLLLLSFCVFFCCCCLDLVLVFYFLSMCCWGNALWYSVPVGFSEAPKPLWYITNICLCRSSTERWQRHPCQDIVWRMKWDLQAVGVS